MLFSDSFDSVNWCITTAWVIDTYLALMSIISSSLNHVHRSGDLSAISSLHIVPSHLPQSCPTSGLFISALHGESQTSRLRFNQSCVCPVDRVRSVDLYDRTSQRSSLLDQKRNSSALFSSIQCTSMTTSRSTMGGLPAGNQLFEYSSVTVLSSPKGIFQLDFNTFTTI